MPLQCGIVGLPNVGKSTIFNALTKSHSAEAANYPFCTIDPNVGIVEVPDKRFDKLCEVVVPKKSVPASVEFVDIAGLVKGASQGEGLGNKFLSHIRQVEAILHIVRCFDDENITHVSGDLDPRDDVEVIELELILSDLEQVEKRLESMKKKFRSGDAEAKKMVPVLEKVFATLKDSKPATATDLTEDEVEIIKDMALLSLKPVIFIGNLPEDDIATPDDNPYFQKLKEVAAQRNTIALSVSGKIESELTALDSEEEKAFLEDMGLSEPGLNKIIRGAYELLGYIVFFTAGEVEVRAWEVLKNTKAPKAASKIHTDIERGFIRVEVTSYADFEEYGTMKKAQTAGKMRVEGKDYIIVDGDIVFFRFNV